MTDALPVPNNCSVTFGWQTEALGLNGEGSRELRASAPRIETREKLATKLEVFLKAAEASYVEQSTPVKARVILSSLVKRQPDVGLIIALIGDNNVHTVQVITNEDCKRVVVTLRKNAANGTEERIGKILQPYM